MVDASLTKFGLGYFRLQLFHEKRRQLIFDLKKAFFDILFGGRFFLLHNDLYLFNKAPNVYRFSMIAFGRVNSVFSIFQLNNVANRVSNGSVILDAQLFQGVDEASLHVTALLCSHGCVH